MPEVNISSSTVSNQTNNVEEYSVAPLSTDGVSGQKETTWQNSRWTQQWGYFNSVPNLKSAILMCGIWNVGKGYTCDARTKAILDHVNSSGKSNFREVLFNLEVTKRIGGDAYAEIIRDPDTNLLLNLKPLDTGSIRIVTNEKGIILRYEQTDKTKSVVETFKPEDILHFSNDRLVDQVHGISVIDALEKTILADEENFDDMKKIMHRQAKPMIMFKIGTDNTAKISEFIDKMDKATNKGENIYIPADKDTLEYEVIQVNVSQIILEWRNDLKNRFYRALGLPEIIFGSSGATESGGKMEYLAHEQVFEHAQLEIEDQIWQQLQLKINLNPPTSMMDNLATDESKDANGQLNIQPSDMMANAGK